MIKRFNDWLAIHIVLFVGTMECAYLFSAFALAPLFEHRLQPLVQFISSSLLQLTLLPIIMVGQTKLSEKTEKRAEQDHEAIMQELVLLKQLHQDIHTALGITSE